MPYNNLTPEEIDIIDNKKTESPFNNEYDNFFKDGVYICRKCNSILFSSQSKFKSGCGWPSFDEEYPNSLLRITDIYDGRTEIQCANCKGHLGHVFKGEHFTKNNTRHCVNSLAIKFIPKGTELPKVLTA